MTEQQFDELHKRLDSAGTARAEIAYRERLLESLEKCDPKSAAALPLDSVYGSKPSVPMEVIAPAIREWCVNDLAKYRQQLAEL